MGIDKSDVRCVMVTFVGIPNGLANRVIRYIIHYDLPKSFEGTFRPLCKMGGDMVPGYYQETGT
jgi:superfamily II DNA helicase RecQ